MRTLYNFLSVIIICVIFSLRVNGQTVSFNTQTLGTGFTGTNGSTGISFVVQNTNAFPAVLTSVSNYFATAGVASFNLWYSALSPSGGPIVLSAPNWSVAASVSGVNCLAGTQTTVFPLLAFTIPAFTTYRFYLETTTLAFNVSYSGLTNPTGCSPLTFSSSGVNLLVGEALISGQFVGWGGLVNNPRAFTGSITLNLLSSPCTGTPNAGTATALPNNPCPGIPVTLSLAGVTSASGLTFQWQRSTTGTGGWTTTGLTAATTNPSFYTPPPGSTTFYRCIVSCSLTGLNDTSNVTGGVAVQPWAATGNCWCIPTYVNGGTGDNITNISLGVLSNNTTTAGNPSPFYVNYTPLQIGLTPTLATPNLNVGIPATLNISYGTDPNQFGAMWIDFNHNGTFDISEYFSPATNAGPGGTHSITFSPPPSSVPGLTRMRIRAGDDVQMNSGQACGPTNSTWGETEDYLVNIIPAGAYDPALTNLTAPVGNLCTDSNQILQAQICNYGSTLINCTNNPVYVSFLVNGPSGLVTYIDTLNTGSLAPFAGGCQTASVGPVNMFAGGTYTINAVVSCPSLSNAFLSNDSLSNAIIIPNYRPTPGPDYPLCQYNIVPFGQGLTVGGCSAPILDSVTINFSILGPCNDGTSDATSCQFATGILPALIPGSSFLGGTLTITNLATIGASWMSEMRFNIYGTAPLGGNIFSPGVQAPGSTSATSTNFTYTRPISPGQLANLYTVVPFGAPVNLGYWESFNDVAGSSDISVNGGGVTTATLKIYYQYVPPSFAWYDVPTLGTSLYSLSPFNPLSVTNALVNNSNVPGVYTFYAACLGLTTCRVPVNFVINETPAAYQDTLTVCEFAVGANNGIFDLTSIDDSVSGNNLAASVIYFGDQALITQIINASNDTSSQNFIYSKVFYPSTGCYSSDSVLLDIKPIPQFTLPVYTGNACAPFAMDISSLINVFPASGNDTLYFQDPAYTIPFLNPHAITLADTLYMIVKSNSGLPCADSSLALIDIIPATNYIANQDTILNFSNCGSVGCGNINMGDGATETLFTTSDCRRIATITDKPNLISMGTTQICEDIDCGIQTHNGQPYVIRHYEITPSTNDSAQVCLYYVQQDFNDFNDYAVINGWDQINPTTNLCITQVDGGILGAPGTTALSIPNSSITSSFDALTSVWTVCFPVDSFSAFYCHTCNPANAALPVELLSFIGKREGSTSSLKWITSSEQNNHHFVVERSKDAKSFTRVSDNIASKGLNGNSHVELNYSFIDMSPMNGHNYYRLQQVDIDGNISESSTVDVYFGEETLVSLYPNPASKTLNLDINTPKSTNAKVKIMDAAGRVVRTIDIPLQAGNNTSQVEVSSLADGMYMIQITNEKGLNYTQTFRKN